SGFGESKEKLYSSATSFPSRNQLDGTAWGGVWEEAESAHPRTAHIRNSASIAQRRTRGSDRLGTPPPSTMCGFYHAYLTKRILTLRSAGNAAGRLTRSGREQARAGRTTNP